MDIVTIEDWNSIVDLAGPPIVKGQTNGTSFPVRPFELHIVIPLARRFVLGEDPRRKNDKQKDRCHRHPGTANQGR
jgi:hypothetical protein